MLQLGLQHIPYIYIDSDVDAALLLDPNSQICDWMILSGSYTTFSRQCGASV